MLAALLLGLILPVLPQVQVPTNDGWVTDLAGMLTAEEEQSLEVLMESYRAGTTHEIALLTVPDLGGETIERFALEVGRAWKMGTAERSNAALLVVAREERKIRIEVARGLEGDLPDGVAWRIIDKVIKPPFKQGRFYDGIRAGIEAMHAAIGGDYGPIQRSEKAPPESLRAGLFVLLWFLVFLFTVTRGGRRGGRGGGLGPLIYMAGMAGGSRSSGGRGLGGFGGGGGGFGGGFGGFGGGGGFSGGGSSGGW